MCSMSNNQAMKSKSPSKSKGEICNSMCCFFRLSINTTAAPKKTLPEHVPSEIPHCTKLSTN